MAIEKLHVGGKAPFLSPCEISVLLARKTPQVQPLIRVCMQGAPLRRDQDILQQHPFFFCSVSGPLLTSSTFRSPIGAWESPALSSALEFTILKISDESISGHVVS